MIEIYQTGPMGETSCAACNSTVYIAWDDAMNRVALDPDDDGAIAVTLDGNRLPWCRDTAGTQLAFDESLYQRHDCTGLATVTPIGDARSLRRLPRPERRRRPA